MKDFMKILTGRTKEHLCSPSSAEKLGVYIHAGVVEDFRKLQREAESAGFDLQIISGFRSFEDQLSIWNRKVRGEIAVLDNNAVPIDIKRLSKKELCFAILRWSALPGASRHHWGTDVDVYDANTKPDDYEIEMIPKEVNSGGMFGPLHDWLDEMMYNDTSFGFFRPYDIDRNGVSPERWHLSYSPVSIPFMGEFSIDFLKETIESADIELKKSLLDNLEEIYHRFIINIGGIINENTPMKR